MHPLVKIVLVVIISVSVGLSGWGSVSLTALLLFPLYLHSIHFFDSAWRMIKRLKWFYLSILIVYLLFSSSNVPSLDSNQVDLSGLLDGLYRVAVLILIVLSVNLLIRTSTKEELLSGLYLLINWFKWLGFCPQTFIVRAYLSLSYIHNLDKQLSSEKRFFKQDRKIKKLVPRLADFIADWIEQSQQQINQSIQINLLKFPQIREWVIPILLILVYIYLPSQIERIL